MKLRYLPPALICLASFSCDKVKNLATNAKSAVESKIAKTSGESGGAAAESELQKFVDQTPEGVIFRKDLLFPAAIEVRTTRLLELSGRFTKSSAIENVASMVKGTQTTVTKLERAGDQVRYTLEKSIFTEPAVESADKPKEAVVTELAPPSKPHTFNKSGSTWVAADSAGFRTVSLARQIAPVFDQLLVENTLAPRTLWFGKKRFKVGDQLTVSGKSLPMFVTGAFKGSLTLTLESFEAVKGHPCGVFKVTGDYSRKQAPDFEGVLTDEDVTIESGKFWLSLIHPLILREETSTIQSTRTGGDGNASSRGQGSVKVSVIREWKKVGP